MTYPNRHRSGFTIVELMIVIAIIAVLASLMVANMRGNKVHESIITLTNDVYSALSSQRTRAMTTSRSTYVILDNRENSRKIDLYVGNDSRCTPVQSALIGIHYSETDIGDFTEQNVGIDLAEGGSQMRTLTAISNNMYYDNDSPRVVFSSDTTLLRINDNTITENPPEAVEGVLSICFQPNGHTEFYIDGSASNANVASVIVASRNGENDSGGTSRINIDRFGNLSSAFVPYSAGGAGGGAGAGAGGGG